MPRFPTLPAGRLSRRAAVELERLSARHHARTTWDEVVDRVADCRAAAVGFDVFDTLLTRAVPDGPQLHRLLADRLVAAGAWTATPEDYVRARYEAGRARPLATLADWYAHPALAAHAEVELCWAIEVELERQLCRAVPGALDALRALRARGEAIDVLSDMHLPVPVLRELLGREGLLDLTRFLLVSCDAGTRKRDGGLYRRWAEQRGCAVDRLVYVGNHPYVDHAVPRGLGMATVPRRAANLNRHERVVAERSVLGAFVAGASVRARLARLFSRDDADPVERGASLTGQTLVGYLLWVRRHCLDAGAEAVAFDGPGAALAAALARAMPAGYWNGIDVVPPVPGCGWERATPGPARIAVATVGPTGARPAAVVRASAASTGSDCLPAVRLGVTAGDRPDGHGAEVRSFLPAGSAWSPGLAAVVAPDEARVWAAAQAVARALPPLELVSPYLGDVDDLATPIAAMLSCSTPLAGVSGSTQPAQGRLLDDRWIRT